MGKIGDAHEEADCIQNVALPWPGHGNHGQVPKNFKLPIEPCDGVESWVKAVNLDPLAIGLEALDHHGLNKHPAWPLQPPLWSSARSKIFVLFNISFSKPLQNNSTTYFEIFDGYRLPLIFRLLHVPRNIWSSLQIWQFGIMTKWDHFKMFDAQW